ncbi:MAG: glyoxalase [Candidatus Aenigmarchaeota archaeon]|nr:glyoxalase [Candidatus Aenigmarchaeota archaeon]
MPTKIFVNLPVKNLGKTKSFFAKLGFKFNKQFTDKNAACMIISKDIYSMLIAKKFFKQFTKKKISNAKKTSEVLLALALGGRTQVDKMANAAIKAGGKEPRPAQDIGWMYSRVFEDLDGHIWESFWMDAKKRKK